VQLLAKPRGADIPTREIILVTYLRGFK